MPNIRSIVVLLCVYVCIPGSLPFSIAPLKRALAREYLTFFEPFREEFYDPDVRFTDPMVRIRLQIDSLVVEYKFSRIGADSF